MNLAVDAKPVRPTIGNSDWDICVHERDRLKAVVERTLADRRLETSVILSETGNYPPWVRVEAWLRDAGADARRTIRCAAQFIVEAKSYYEYPIVYTAIASCGTRNIRLNQRPTFTDADVADWLNFALGRCRSPATYRPVLDAITALFLAFVPFLHKPHSNRIDKVYRPNRWSPGKILWPIAIVCFSLGVQFFDSQSDAAWMGLVFVAFGIAAALSAIVLGRTTMKTVVVSPEPAVAPPRRLVLVDSWHAIATGLAGRAAALEARLEKSIKAAVAASPMGWQFDVEHLTYRTPNGYMERDRRVLRKGQAAVHLDINTFGQDLFVGWHAYLNWAQWQETAPVSSRVSTRVTTEFRALVPGTYVPNQLDLIDLNCLSELVHRCMRQEIERLLKEEQIDQEIDFEILRGDRDRALDRKRYAADAEGKDTIWSRAMRQLGSWQSEGTRQFAPALTPDVAPAIDRGRGFWAGVVTAIFAIVAYNLVFQSDFFGQWIIPVDVGLPYPIRVMPMIYVIPAAIIGLAALFFSSVPFSRALLIAVLVLFATAIFNFATSVATSLLRGAFEPSPFIFIAFSSAAFSLAMLAVLSRFFSFFRSFSVCLLLALFYGIASAVAIQFRSYPSDASLGMNQTLFTFMYSAVRGVFFGVIGYGLRRSAGEQRR